MINGLSGGARIGIAFSGGGLRAASFHAGVVKWLAEEGLLESVTHISTVSGGSLLAGLVFSLSGNRWPSSRQYLIEIFPQIRELLTTKSLQNDSLKRLTLKPSNWKLLLARANVIAQSIEELWGVTGVIGELPSTPIWSNNATTAETGRRFRFKQNVIGDYEVGYAYANNFKLSEAMAVAVAFPGGIGPLLLDTSRYQSIQVV